MTFELRDYQIEGVDFMRRNKRVLLRDHPGLGKTAQAAFAAEPPCLIVAPNYLVEQWANWLRGEDEKSIERNNGEIVPNVKGNIVAALGLRGERIKTLESYPDWLVINVEMLGNYEHFTNSKWVRQWRTIIFDESHHLKAHNGKRARTAVKLAQHAEYVYLLTATPVKREIDDFFMQLRILQPDVFTSYWRFVQSFCIVEQNYFGTQILGAKKSMLPELQKILSLMSIGRDYETAGRSLPPVIEKYIPIKLSPEIRKLYDSALEYWRIQDEEGELTFTSYMQAMHTIRQHLTGYLKADVVKQLIEDDSRQSVAFSWYKNTAESIADSVENCELVTGDIDVMERQLRALKGNHISATISSLSEGIDLSTARNVIFAEEDWTPGSNYQALSRVRRERLTESNEEPVIIYYVHCERTIDEIIHRRSKDRGATVKEVIKEALYQ